MYLNYVTRWNNLSNKKKKKGKEKKSLLEAFTSRKGNYIAAIQQKNDIHVCVFQADPLDTSLIFM